jgi:hypothetical protein
VVPNARLRPTAKRRFEQDFERPVELRAGGVKVSELELALTGLEIPG